jgi:PAS domain S-box-containing protein
VRFDFSALFNMIFIIFFHIIRINNSAFIKSTEPLTSGMINPFEQSVVSNHAFREIFQSMTEGIIVVDAEGKILVANPVAEEMFGFGVHELTGVMLERLLPERYRSKHIRFRSSFNEKPTPRRMGLGRDLTALKKNGQEFPVEISLSYSGTGENFIAIAFISDISLRKKAEDILKQSEEQLIVYASELEKKVEARTEALNKTVHDLENEVRERQKAEEEVRKALARERELNELKSKFVSIASHEFRTPLSAILSSVSLIDQYKQRNDLEKMEKHIQRVRSSVNHLTSILNDFLSLGKLEEGKITIEPEDVDLQQLMDDLLEEVKLTLKEGQFINTSGIERFPNFRTDARILRNILLNLLSNASKYSDAAKPIEVSCYREANMVTFQIRDHGIGIPPDECKHLFERFFRASNATAIQGTGLGLNIVKRYVELLNGTISFESVYGKGSIFTIAIPQQI